MKCSWCDQPLSEDDTYCPKCGIQVDPMASDPTIGTDTEGVQPKSLEKDILVIKYSAANLLFPFIIIATIEILILILVPKLLSSIEFGAPWNLKIEDKGANPVVASSLKVILYGTGALIALIFLLKSMSKLLGRCYVMTTDRLIFYRGFVIRSIYDVELKHVDDLVVRQSLFARLVDTGDVHIISDASPLTGLILEGIQKPVHIKELIRAQARQAQKRKKG